MKKLIQKILSKKGYQITAYPSHDVQRRMQLIRQSGINVILDVGANDGKYATDLREFGYEEKIISFEPLNGAFKDLEANAAKFNKWSVNNFALGDYDGEATINVSGNSVSSSILNMLESHLEVAPDSKFVNSEEIKIAKLDTIYSRYCDISDKVMLKIDTQGFEKNVLDGAEESLKLIKIIQLELSIVPLYSNETLFDDMLGYLKKRGFNLFSIENGMSSNTTGQLLQVDGVFIHNGL